MEKEELKSIVRIVDKSIEGHLALCHALTKVKGVDWSMANAICSVLNLDPVLKVGNLSVAQIQKVEQAIRAPTKHGIPAWLVNRQRDPESGVDRHLVASDLSLQQQFDIRAMRKIKSYRGIRHALGLPVRGQKTRSSFRKGTVVGVVRKKQMPAMAGEKKGKREKK